MEKDLLKDVVLALASLMRLWRSMFEDTASGGKNVIKADGYSMVCQRVYDVM